MARRRPPIWLLLAAAAYLAYFALLIYCHAHRPAGVAAGGGTRAARDAYTLTLPLAAATFEPRRDVVLYGFRGVQLVTLVLAITVAFKRPRDPIALTGAWLLATAGVFSVALPAGWASGWRLLPAAVTWPMWLPFLSTLAAGGILFLFAARFTRRARAAGAPALAGLAALLAAPLVARALSRMGAVYGWDVAPTGWDAPLVMILINAVPAIAGLGLLFHHYSGARDIVEKRRAHLVLTGGSLGLAAGIAVMAAAGRSGPHPGQSLFASTSMTAGTLLFLLFPLSLAYAILKYRLFGFRAAIRLGLRYAVARRALLSIVPIAAAALVFDIWSHGDRPLQEVLSARAGVYLLIAAAALAAHLTRDQWLARLDQLFFRERYDATRLLMDLVGELRSAKGFDEVAALAVSRIARALHPRFAIIGAAPAPGAAFATASAFRPEQAPALPPPSSVLMELARVLKRPMDVAPDASGWLSERLPESEVQYLRDGGVELLVPISGAPGGVDAVMLLGPKQSEEPYTREDRDLLSAIADSLALRIAAVPAPARLRDVELPRVIGARYRLESVIGRGGMGVVYDARDLTLDRRVAVKLMRDELIDAPGARRRFEAEARSAAAFAHPHVVTIHDFNATGDGTAMIVMELLEGRTLREELGAPVAPSRALWITSSVADAIDAGHARGLLHRDLKPENIFLAALAQGEGVKVLDFGIARPLDPAAGGATQATLDGVLLGTPRYMAPEQLAGGRPSASWDIWALAVIACEMLSGAHPFAGTRAPMTPALEAFFARALAPHSGDRFPSARDMAARLADALDASPV